MYDNTYSYFLIICKEKENKTDVYVNKFNAHISVFLIHLLRIKNDGLFCTSNMFQILLKPMKL